jgi:hypothetical protein
MKSFTSFTQFVAGIALLTSVSVAPMLAHAQTYKGDAYGANISINATLVGVGATIVDNPNLPASGSNVPLTNQLLNANVQATSGGIIPTIFTVLNANAINTSTIGTGGVATSTSQILGASLYPNFGINLGLLGGLNLNSLVTADVIRTTTTADANGNSGRTEITNLNFGGTSLGNFDILHGTELKYFLNLAGGVSANASGSILLPDIAELTINEQFLTDSGSTRTTNAISLRVLPANQLASGKVTVASSTAGFVPAPGGNQVPEPASLALITLAAVPFTARLAARRRRK